MKSIYCISGLGADEKIFSKLDFGEAKVSFISWKMPEKKESIESYARRMAEEIKDESPILIGVSFGGMMCIEIAKIISVSKIILISSVKSFKEMPLFMRLAGKSRLNKVIPIKSYSFLHSFQNWRLGVVTEEDRKLANAYRQKFNQQYLDWSIHQILNWKNDSHPNYLIHIHGDHDLMFPIKRLQADYVIKGGTHFMVLNRAEEVNKILKTILT